MGQSPQNFFLGYLVFSVIFLLTENLGIDKMPNMEILHSSICRSLLLWTSSYSTILQKAFQFHVAKGISLISHCLVCMEVLAIR